MIRQLRCCVAITSLVLVMFTTTVWACKVPVFRYALERWYADKYEVLIIHDDSISATSQRLVEKLKSPKLGETLNLEVKLISQQSLRDKRLVQLWDKRTNLNDALMVVLFPKTAAEVPDRVLASTPLTEANVQRLVESPLRKQIAKRLSEGQTAVWIFVPCGVEAKDAKALDVLGKRMQVNRERLTVPSADELEIEPVILAKNKIPLRIEFSLVTLDPNDAEESFLLSALMKSEIDLDATQPMAFPVFGRGRVLYALVGDGIMSETIDDTCQFISGPCSCQVKNQNPGFDLLIDSDWTSAVAGSMISDAIPEDESEPKLLTIPSGSKKK